MILLHIIVCVDDRNGISFCGRRLSRDRVQITKMLELVANSRLYVSSYTAKLFENPPSNLIVCDDYLTVAEENDYCFAENGDFMNNPDKIEDIIIYRWNKKYPFDVGLAYSVLSTRRCVSVKEFVGNSHVRITEEVMKK